MVLHIKVDLTATRLLPQLQGNLSEGELSTSDEGPAGRVVKFKIYQTILTPF